MLTFIFQQRVVRGGFLAFLKLFALKILKKIQILLIDLSFHKN
tara:strand:+ start:1230 stop:1358 length:129 start_codon:yes stop_codon:yes gene_type:complete